MKLLRYGEPGAEKPGMLAIDGSIRDLSGVVADIDGRVLSPDKLAELGAVDPMSLPAPEEICDPFVELASPACDRNGEVVKLA